MAHKPTTTRGYVQQGEEPARLVAEDAWQAMNEIMVATSVTLSG